MKNKSVNKNIKFLKNLKKASDAKKVPPAVHKMLDDKRKVSRRKNIKKLAVKHGNSYVKREKSVLLKEPTKTCNARLRRTDGYCSRPAGFGTTHPGTGRCKFHGGDAGRKPTKTLDIYSYALKNEAKEDLGVLSEDKSIEAELAVSKLIVKGNMEEYQNREVTPYILYQAVFELLDTLILKERLNQYVITENFKTKDEDKKITVAQIEKRYTSNKPELRKLVEKVPIYHLDPSYLANHIIKTTKLLKMSLMDQGKELRDALETVSKLAEKHHDMTEGKKLVISLDGVKDILYAQANIINSVCMNCEKRLEIARRLNSSLSVQKTESAEFSVIENKEPVNKRDDDKEAS